MKTITFMLVLLGFLYVLAKKKLLPRIKNKASGTSGELAVVPSSEKGVYYEMRCFGCGVGTDAEELEHEIQCALSVLCDRLITRGVRYQIDFYTAGFVLVMAVRYEM